MLPAPASRRVFGCVWNARNQPEFAASLLPRHRKNGRGFASSDLRFWRFSDKSRESSRSSAKCVPKTAAAYIAVPSDAILHRRAALTVQARTRCLCSKQPTNAKSDAKRYFAFNLRAEVNADYRTEIFNIKVLRAMTRFFLESRLDR